MATTKIGVYRSYFGPVPKDSSGRPLPKSHWPRKRAHSWVVRWFGSDGNRYSKSFPGRKEADRFVQAKQSEVREGRSDPPPEITLRQFADEHGKVMVGQVARHSLASQMCALRAFMKQVGEDIKLSAIRPRQAEAYVASRLAAGASIATVNKDIRTLKGVFNKAVEPRGYLLPSQNPFAKIRQRRQSAKPLRFVTPGEIQALVKAADTPLWKALLLVAYTTGARLGEIVNLTWADVDFEDERIRVVRKQAEADLADWEPKDHESRLLPVPSDVIRILADLRAAAADGCPYVFVPAWRWQHVCEERMAGRWRDGQALVNNLNRNLKVLRKRAGVARLTFHDLRRSCLTNWARALPIHVAKKLAGHSDIKTTQQFYLAVQEDDLEKARSVQVGILNGITTDQLLTNSAEKGVSGRRNAVKRLRATG